MGATGVHVDGIVKRLLDTCVRIGSHGLETMHMRSIGQQRAAMGVMGHASWWVAAQLRVEAEAL
jgi:hypothetical protein